MKLAYVSEGFYPLPDDFDVAPIDDDGDPTAAERIFALMLELDDYDSYRYAVNGKTVSNGKQEWLVVTDDEADELWDQELENYLDECVPGADGPYFDRERWKRDARIDGRAHSLARYDGNEEEQEVNDTTYYLYRQN